ncbi:MAG: twin-arginine translocation signal domain-containing protein [Terracidiphilus sp.]
MKKMSDLQDNRNIEPPSPGRRTFVKGIAAIGAGVATFPLMTTPAEAKTLAAADNPNPSQSNGAEVALQTPKTFQGDKIDWHGFDRYDFVMDMQTLAITPFKALAGEESGSLGTSAQGQLRCVVVVPRQAAPGNPWSWRGVYWNHQPQAEVELLKRGFHIVYISVDPTPKSLTEWDAWYAFLTGQYGLSKKPAFIGMSRGGEFEYRWGTANPEKISCIYADNPGMDRDGFQRLGDLARADVPILQVCGTIDPIFGKFASAIDAIYREFGGRISMMVKEGYAHHPHSLRNPKPIADFIEQSVQAVRGPAPEFVGDSFTRTSYYSIENFYRDYPDEDTYITCRGPLFSPCYNRYEFRVSGASMSATVIVPNTVAAGMPWVYRAGFVFRDAKVDQELLAKGFHIVTAPVTTNADGPLMKDWDAAYEYLVAHGFAKKPVIEGAGGGAGEMYEWAIENPDKVSCVYAENPRMRSALAKTQPLDNLAPLAKAKVPLLHICGSLDPWFKDNTLEVEKRYKQLGGKIEVIVKRGVGHYPLGPDEPAPVVDFIVRAATHG